MQAKAKKTRKTLLMIIILMRMTMQKKVTTMKTKMKQRVKIKTISRCYILRLHDPLFLATQRADFPIELNEVADSDDEPIIVEEMNQVEKIARRLSQFKNR